ncbi:Uncharacterized protein YpuA, DUF1002 family [Clostridium sp. DSM 8431]|uniref:DUF1002 domain-containing protein n=1 Tax=Clostridium sp. DSM 8431 TaxID=1761781 RepID=UPI0008E43E4A|nr:DUF1002 domain-containing protein [Clostridium sp. DSM 8431]SFU70054.1 Uncharacterized protein YpuA, DUF1002 family [Clostridium sp. DSM 8431]
MKRKSLISKAIITVLSASLFLTTLSPIAAKADSYTVVTLGADLTQTQKDDMLKYFGVTKNDAEIIEITSEEEYQALGNIASSAQLGNKSISSSYVEPTSSGGLDISTNNLTWVTDAMIRNALITAGVENAVVKASAPFKVSGTAALTGILKGFETSKDGQTIDEDKKQAANEELVVTGDLGEEIGQDDATNLINNIKKDVIKKNPSSDKQIEKIVDKYSDPYDLSEENREQIVNLMEKINALDLNYNSLKEQLNDVSAQLKDKVSNVDAQGVLTRLGNFFSDIWTAVKNLFSSDDSSSNTNTTSNNSSNTNSTEATDNKDTTSNNNTSNNVAPSNNASNN